MAPTTPGLGADIPVQLFGWYQEFTFSEIADGPVFVLFIGPLVASAAALLTEAAPDADPAWRRDTG